MEKIGRTIKRRRREGKTDYRARLALLKSGMPRVVIRKTNSYIIAQIVESDIAQDRTMVKVSSKDLILSGWPKEKIGSLKSLGAAYLTGILLAKKAGRIKKAIVDIGLQRNVKQGRLYAVVKGAIEGGLDIPCDEESLPADENINKNNSEIIKKTKEKILK